MEPNRGSTRATGGPYKELLRLLGLKEETVSAAVHFGQLVELKETTLCVKLAFLLDVGKQGAKVIQEMALPVSP